MSILVKKIKNLTPVVKHCLEQSPKARDNDKLLILKIWAHQNPKLRDEQYTFMKFAECFLNNEYSDTESIRRTRQKLQAEHPELRGENYKRRHKECEDTRKSINN